MAPTPAPGATRLYWPLLVLALLAGAAFGLGGLTFAYADGTGYLFDDPATCANCHVMRDVYDSWNRSPHHAVAVCNDCHTPHAFPIKYVIKGINGVNHSTRFTLGDYPVNIRMTALNTQVVHDNCVECHADTVSPIISITGRHTEDVDCIRCHADVGH